jgi:hypothetical protein
MKADADSISKKYKFVNGYGKKQSAFAITGERDF